MMNIVKRFVLVFLLAPMITHQVAAETTAQHIGVITSLALFPATVAEVIVDAKGSEKAKKITKTIVEGSYLLSSAVATFNHRNDFDTNKYNIFRLLTHGCYFGKHMYDLLHMDIHDAKKLNQDNPKKQKSLKAKVTKIALGGIEALCGIGLSFSHDEKEINENPVGSSLASFFMCVHKALNEEEWMGTTAWLTAAGAHVKFVGDEGNRIKQKKRTREEIALLDEQEKHDREHVIALQNAELHILRDQFSISLRGVKQTEFMNRQVDENENCSVCLEPLSQDPYRKLIPCGHAFHIGCINESANALGQSCPNCRCHYT